MAFGDALPGFIHFVEAGSLLLTTVYNLLLLTLLYLFLSGRFEPVREIPFLFDCQTVDLHTHRFQLNLCNLTINAGWHRYDSSAHNMAPGPAITQGDHEISRCRADVKTSGNAVPPGERLFLDETFANTLQNAHGLKSPFNAPLAALSKC